MEQILTAQQAADYIGVHVDNYRQGVREGKFPGRRLGGTGRIRVLRSQLDELVAGTWQSDDDE